MRFQTLRKWISRNRHMSNEMLKINLKCFDFYFIATSDVADLQYCFFIYSSMSLVLAEFCIVFSYICQCIRQWYEFLQI